jgi:hypothetical protein
MITVIPHTKTCFKRLPSTFPYCIKYTISCYYSLPVILMRPSRRLLRTRVSFTSVNSVSLLALFRLNRRKHILRKEREACVILFHARIMIRMFDQQRTFVYFLLFAELSACFAFICLAFRLRLLVFHICMFWSWIIFTEPRFFEEGSV